MTAELLEGTFSYTACRSHYTVIWFMSYCLGIEESIPKTATNPGEMSLNLAFDASTVSRATMATGQSKTCSTMTHVIRRMITEKHASFS